MGYNGDGALGDGTWTDRNAPVQDSRRWGTSVAAGAYHSLILKTDGSLWAMGLQCDGALATGRRASATLRYRFSRVGYKRWRRALITA